MVKVWDLFVRLSHWLIVLLVVSAWVSAHYGDVEYKWHTWNGYTVFVLVITRLIWGIVGSTSARFSQFLTFPKRILLYLIDLVRGEAPNYLGHNPAGGWMVITVLFVLLAQATTGLFSSDDIVNEGPFVYYASSDVVALMTGWHHFFFDLLTILIVLHVLAVLYHQIIKKEKIIMAMIHGRKLSTSKCEPIFVFRSFYFALLILLMIAFVFWMVLRTYS